MLNSSLIGKVQKAKIYAEEKAERVAFSSFTAKFRGDNDSYVLGFQDGKLHCTCHFFDGHGLCSHTLALEKILEGMLPNQTIASA